MASPHSVTFQTSPCVGSMPRPPTLLLPGHEGNQMGNQITLMKTPPVICEQGPSAPSSPTSPDERPFCSSLTEDAMQRINLLTTGYGHDYAKLSPGCLSPSYATSDLGSSPRSSISVTTSSSLGPWSAYRDYHKNSFDLDDGASDVCSKDLLSPGMMLSPAPYSPFSDCDGRETPFSNYGRSPNLSPHQSTDIHHFNFDPIRSCSSMSNRKHVLSVPSASLDAESRERSRSDSDMSPKDENMDTSVHSTVSVPATTSRQMSSSGQYKKRLLQKYQEEQQQRPLRSSSSPPPSATESEIDEFDLRSVSRVEERPHTPANEHGLNLKSALPPEAIPTWIERQMLACLHNAFLQVPNPQLLAPPPHIEASHRLHERQSTMDESCGPIKGATLWRRSRSETDISRSNQAIAHNFANGVFACSSCGAGFSCHDRLAKHIASRHRDRSGAAAQDEGAKVHKCTQCTKKFTRSDMLTRHMRLHTGAKPYECKECGQVFSRSDHLSTHQRTHTGEKPYQCSKCPYTASRRDMITRHFRTHDIKEGADLPLAQLSLSSPHGSSMSSHQPFALSPSSPIPNISTVNPLFGHNAMDSSPSGLGSGERSAFVPTVSSRLLAPPPLIHSLSVPSSPMLSRQHSISPSLSRQSSIGGYETTTYLPS